MADGYCQCGCGEKTRMAPQTSKEKGWVAGEPVRYVRGHGNRGRKLRKGPDYILNPATGCWEWQHSTVSGYGYAAFDGIRRLAHRYFYEEEVGPVPTGMELDHLCRNRACVNPDHLEIVTRAENTQRGDATKLSPELVHKIRHIWQDSASEIARRLGVSKSAVVHARAGHTWKNIA